MPVAVVAVETDSTCAIAASYEAKAFGVKTGTGIHEAKRLCPGLVCVLARHERYVEFHHRLIEEIERHIPVTAVCSIDEVACRLMDNEISVERSTEIAHSIKSGIANNIGSHLRCSIGIAPNRYLAKVGTELQKPDGLVVLSSGGSASEAFQLCNCGICRGRRQYRTAHPDELASLICRVCSRSVRSRRARFGAASGAKRSGIYCAGWNCRKRLSVRRSIGHSHVMAPELRDPVKAKDVARRLTLKAASRLRRMDYYAGAMSFAAQLENGLRVHAEGRFYRAQDNKTFLDLLNRLWSQALKSEPSG